MFREFFRAKFLLAEFFCLFYVWVCVKPETPRPNSSSQRVRSQGLGGLGRSDCWEHWGTVGGSGILGSWWPVGSIHYLDWIISCHLDAWYQLPYLLASLIYCIVARSIGLAYQSLCWLIMVVLSELDLTGSGINQVSWSCLTLHYIGIIQSVYST